MRQDYESHLLNAHEYLIKCRRKMLWIATTSFMALIALNGCQVFQPYVIPSHYAETDRASNKICKGPTSTTDELAFARGIERQLSCFARQHSEFASAVGYTLIPLAALVAYQGFKPSNPHNVAALSALGFAAYGITNYQYRPRDVIYLAGVAAVDCAIQIATPSILSPSQSVNLNARYVEFDAKLNDSLVGLSVSSVEIQLARISLFEAKVLRTTIGKGKSTDELRMALDEAIAVVATRVTGTSERLNATRTRLVELTSRYFQSTALNEQVRKELASTAESIVNSVNAQISTMIPNPASLASLLGNMKLPQPAPPISSDATASGGESADSKILRASSLLSPANRAYGASTGNLALDDAAAQIISLLTSAEAHLSKAEEKIVFAETVMAPLSSELRTINEPTNLEKMYNECAIKPKFPTALSIALPKEGVLIQSGGQPVNIPIVGGSGKYSPVVVDPPAKGSLVVDVKQGSGNSSILSFTAKDFDKDVEMLVLVQDDSGSSYQFSVKIKK